MLFTCQLLEVNYKVIGDKNKIGGKKAKIDNDKDTANWLINFNFFNLDKS